MNSGLAWSLPTATEAEESARLNPFEFRAGLERKGDAKRGGVIVLIPLNSGLAWSALLYACNCMKGLNPFEFRAGLEPEVLEEAIDWRLNPFEFRAGLERMRHR